MKMRQGILLGALSILMGVILSMPSGVLAAAGDLDSTFGAPNGYVLSNYPSGTSSVFNGVLLQPDQKIVAGGYTNASGYYPLVVRFNSNGSVDTSFGSSGYAVYSGTTGFVYSLAIQTDGKIVAAGESQGTAAVWRFTESGQLDAGFGTNGIVVYQSTGASKFKGVKIQQDGKIIVAGFTDTDAILMRYNSNGTSDSGFGSSGAATFHSAGYDSSKFWGLDLQSDGKSIVVGFEYIGYNPELVALRFNSNGTLDSSFGTNGVFVHSALKGMSVAIQPNGYIVIGASGADSTVLRLDANGALDAGFGTGGIATHSGPEVAWQDEVFSVALLASGKLVTTGAVTANGAADTNVDTLRFNYDGTLDTGFGTQGVVSFAGFTNGRDFGYSVAEQSDGKIIVAGETQDGTSPKGLLIRLLPTYYTIGTPTVSTSGCNGFTSCSPNPIWEGGDSQCAIVPNGGCYTKTLRITQAMTYTVDPVWAYYFQNVILPASIQATFAPAQIGLYKVEGRPPVENWQKTDDTFSAAFTDVTTLNSNLIKVLSGSYYNLAGMSCNDIGNVIPTLSGEWISLDSRGTTPTVLSTNLTISGTCALIIDGITIQ